MRVTSKFKLGQMVMTHEVSAQRASNTAFADFLIESLGRYMNCDWGDLEQEDKELSDEAAQNGNLRIFAAYTDPQTNDKIWIITEWDRSVTTILFPHEY